ncbi:transketolase [Mesorhizobium sp. M00.F.Ca.ET.186.01.1.1]|nr:transketolase [bacterium M00.F.Ca.ET.205.01.1.1]TGU53332.1 transketolase [bacterium M00.F.Ca.ET.152.01.1.1]TGV36845.1 transketolase [Mesorhizobium sp. M00.F.Ca.ET.186.01.1.1]TGZ41739.1 transketolase [bacterium M00.F.Ca.ET.162.01.1.1]
MKPDQPFADGQVLSSRALRKLILEESYRAHVGHIGSALSVVDLLAALYGGGAIRLKSPDDPDRDRFVLGKGHAALALYATLFLRGWLSRAELASYCVDDSRLGVHPTHHLPGVDFSTGSLGLGLSIGAGSALAARLLDKDRRTYVLLSDAECNEGSTWEAAMFAGHHRLANLIVVVDVNGQQALGPTAEIINQSRMPERWTSCGWTVREVDGHVPAAVREALRPHHAEPLVVLAQTVLGRGVSFMERQVHWHYLPMSDEEYAKALAESEALQ